jgi:hypothetical protein
MPRGSTRPHPARRSTSALRRWTLACGILVILGTVPFIGCGTTNEQVSPPDDEVARRAVGYLATVQGELDPLHKSFAAWIGRNWGWTDLVDLKDRAAADARDGLAAGYESVPEVTALARISLPSERQPLIDARSVPINETSVAIHAALYCDTRSVDASDTELLRRHSSGDGYDATHALLAALIAKDLGCDDALWDEVMQTSIDRVESELVWRLASSPSLDAAVDDLSLEQTAFLLQAGRRAAITPEWMAAIRSRQLDDGGWSDMDPGQEEQSSKWHATLVALWALSAWSSAGSNAGLPGTS